MLHLVIGEINAGKTWYLQNHYQSHHSGDGVIALKVMEGPEIIGFNAHFLASGITQTFMKHELKYMDEFEQIGRIGPYIFDQAVFNNILEYLHALIENNVTPIYIDEIGRYELNGHGYHDIIKTIVRHKLEAYFTCHQNLANEIIDYFNLEPVDIINVKGTNHV